MGVRKHTRAMPDYGSALQFGLSVTPETAHIEAISELVQLADSTGLDLIAIQDHAYNQTFLDTWTLIAFLAAKTRQIHFMPDVADLPLRPPPMLAKAVATLDRLTDGRAEIAIGAGAFWDAIAGMGGPRRAPGDAVAATTEALEILRDAFAGTGRVVSPGQHYPVPGYHAGPPPAHDIRLWVGAAKPRMLQLIGRHAGGWVSPLSIYTPPNEVPQSHAIIDAAASAAGRNPSEVRRLYNVVGSIGPRSGGQGLNGPVGLWIERLTEWATDLGLDTFVFWPEEATEQQVRQFAEEVVPGVLEEVNAMRTTTAGTF
jgi:alkanesulfonate monooxygenase SsuD/methylene tetrahydromethanopterin reductase-like flavin-dependent oxidoreductase (luciferase family)